MVFNRSEAAKRAEAAQTNVPGQCQWWTRDIFGAESAGDRDHDGDADAVDGWHSEPIRFRHAGDRNPPRGTPVSFHGGRLGFGHRAVSRGPGVGPRNIRTTDMLDGHYAPGHVGNASIEEIERSMGVSYTGWSESITGHYIPKMEGDKPVPAEPTGPLTRGPKVDEALRKLRHAKAKRGTLRRTLIDRAIMVLERINGHHKRG